MALVVVSTWEDLDESDSEEKGFGKVENLYLMANTRFEPHQTTQIMRLTSLTYTLSLNIS